MKKTPYKLFYNKYKNMDKDLIVRRFKNNNVFFTVEKIDLLESLLALIDYKNDIINEIFEPDKMMEMNMQYLINIVLKEQDNDFLKNKKNIEYLIKEKISDIEYIFGLDILENITSSNNIMREIENNIYLINKKMKESVNLESFKESVKLKKELIYVSSIILKINELEVSDIKHSYEKDILKSKNYYNIKLIEDNAPSEHKKERVSKKHNLKNKITLKLKMKYFK